MSSHKNRNRKGLFLLMLLNVSILITLTACSNSNNPSLLENSTLSETNSTITSSKTNESSNTPSEAESSKIDLDLTQLSSTMIYSEVYNMVVTPSNYTGKTIKVTGTFATTYDEKAKQRYYAIIIPDATACCEQGLEFVWTGNHSYPEDYPKVGQEITVTGTFGTYEHDGYTYKQLTCDEVIFSNADHGA